MTDKIVLTPVSNPQNLTSLATQINANNAIIETAFNNNLSRDGTSPNQMLSNLDMNNNQILNLPSPAGPNSPVRLSDVTTNPNITVPPVGTSGATVGLLNTGWTQSGANTWTGINNFTNSVSFSSITLPANSVNSSNVTDGSLVGADLATNTVANSNLAQMAGNTIKGNNTGGTSNALDLTVQQVSAVLGVAANTSTVKTANYTVVNADNGSTLLLGGGAFYTITISSLAGYSGNFACKLINQDTSRGKAISISGFNTFILWPGQSTLVLAGSGTWTYTDPGRWRKPGLIFYVDVSAGNDGNDGLAAGGGNAFNTIGKAVSMVYSQIDCAGGQPRINIANGTYGETVVVQGQITGYNVLFLVGASPSGVVWRPLSGFCLLVADGAELEIQNIKFDNNGGPTANNAITIHQTGILDILSGCEFGNFGGGTHMVMDHGGGSLNLPASYIISGGTSTHLQMGGGCSVTMVGGGTVTITGSPTITTFMSLTGSGANVSLAPGTTFGSPATGCQKYIVTLNGTISLSGNTLPGSVAGTTATGGQVA